MFRIKIVTKIRKSQKRDSKREEKRVTKFVKAQFCQLKMNFGRFLQSVTANLDGYVGILFTSSLRLHRGCEEVPLEGAGDTFCCVIADLICCLECMEEKCRFTWQTGSSTASFFLAFLDSYRQIGSDWLNLADRYCLF